MWWDRFKRRRASAWLGETRVAWMLSGSEGVHAVNTASLGESLAQLNAWHQAAGRPELHVVLEGALCRLQSMAPVAGVRNAEEAQAVIDASAPAGGDAQLLKQALDGSFWWFLALPPGLRSDLQTLFGAKLCSLRPWWWWLLNLEQGRHAAFDGKTVSYCWANQGGNLPMAGDVGPFGDLAAAQRWLQRQRLQLGMEPVQLVWLEWDQASEDGETERGVHFPFKRWLREASV